MKLAFIKHPHYILPEAYESAIKRMVQRLKLVDGVCSIYQVGGTSSPGISDIDLVVVFEDGARCLLDPRQGLSEREQYLFSHGLYGVRETHFREAQKFTFFHNYRLLWGRGFPINGYALSPEEVRMLKTQVALEYLVKMYITRSIEQTYGIVNVRAFLVQIKALRYDLEFLGISSGRLAEVVETMADRCKSWFEEKQEESALEGLFCDFCEEFVRFLEAVFEKEKFYLPEWASLSPAPSIRIVPSEKLCYSHKGVTLPPRLAWLGRKYFNLQHRFNRFWFELPVHRQGIPKVLDKQFAFLREMREHTQAHFPLFMPLASSLNYDGHPSATGT